MTANGNSSPASANYALGELDLDVQRSNPPPRAPESGRAAGGSPGELDLSGFGGPDDSAVLELADVGHDAPWRGQLDTGGEAGCEEDPLQPDTYAASPELEDVPRRPAQRRHGGEERSQEIAGTPDQRARQLGNYGPSPAGLLGSVAYALGVLKRRRALATNRKLLTRQLDELRARLDEALADLGRALIQHDEADLGPVREEHATALAARAAADEADQTAAGTRRDTEAQIRDLETHIAELRQAAAPYQQALEEADLAQRAATETRARAEAMRKRVDIEVRALEGAQASPDAQTVLDLNERRSQREADLLEAQQQLDAASASLEDARRELTMRQREIDLSDKQRRKLMDQADRAQRKLESAVEGAVGALTQRLRALGRAASDAGITLGGDRARRVGELDKLAADLVDQKELHGLAQSRYDHRAFRRGAVVVGLLVASAVGPLVASLVLP